jgi:hypothetical protein
MQTFQPDLDWFDGFARYLGGAQEIERKARECGAFQRARRVKSAFDLVRLALMYGPGGLSLRGLAAAAEADGVAQISDPAVFKRLHKSADFIEALCCDALAFAEKAVARPEPRPDGEAPASRPLRLVDASRLEGPNGRCWRLHMAYDPRAARILEAKITAMKAGESLRRFCPQPGDIVIADRGYAQPEGLRQAVEAGADVIVRVTWNSLKLTDIQGRPLDWLALLGRARDCQTLEIPVLVNKPRGRFAPFPMRLLVIKKPPEAAEKARGQALRANQKDQRKRIDPRTLESADFLMLLTSLPAEAFPIGAVAELYRVRWQIELAFKRLKSILHIDQLPAKSDEIARTWLHAHLLLALYADHIQDVLDVFSP